MSFITSSNSTQKSLLTPEARLRKGRATSVSPSLIATSTDKLRTKQDHDRLFRKQEWKPAVHHDNIADPFGYYEKEISRSRSISRVKVGSLKSSVHRRNRLSRLMADQLKEQDNLNICRKEIADRVKREALAAAREKARKEAMQKESKGTKALWLAAKAVAGMSLLSNLHKKVPVVDSSKS